MTYFCSLWVSFGFNFNVSCVERLYIGQYQYWVTENVAIVNAPLVCYASVFLQGMSWVISSSMLSWTTELKVFNPLHLVILFSLKSVFFHWVVRTNPREGCARLVGQQRAVGLPLLPFPMPDFPRSLGIGGSPSCATEARCVQPATAECLGRKELADFRTTLHSISPKQCVYIHFDLGLRRIKCS